MRTTAPKLVDAITAMNAVGISRMRRYVYFNHPGENFDRNLEVIKYAAKAGYTAAGKEFSISKQRVHQIVETYHKYAREIWRSETANLTLKGYLRKEN